RKIHNPVNGQRAGDEYVESIIFHLISLPENHFAVNYPRPALRENLRGFFRFPNLRNRPPLQKSGRVLGEK
ncbi:MAG: hypothetical protein WC745_05225, partial [Patescibacteria group bacterium]